MFVKRKQHKILWRNFCEICLLLQRPHDIYKNFHNFKNHQNPQNSRYITISTKRCLATKIAIFFVKHHFCDFIAQEICAVQPIQLTQHYEGHTPGKVRSISFGLLFSISSSFSLRNSMTTSSSKSET